MTSVKPKQFKYSRTFKDQAVLTIFDAQFCINHKPAIGQKTQFFVVEGAEVNQLDVYCLSKDFHNEIIKWLSAQSKLYFQKKSILFAKKLGVSVNRVTIKDLRSRWGSCSSLGNLNYSWRLALAPETIAEYLCAHEVSHLKEMNHSKDFWHLVKGLYPDYQAARCWLKQHGTKLINITKK